jgi:hypothetical protein
MSDDSRTADAIFLDKRNSGLTSNWVYYRVTGIGNVDIEICRVTFPDCKDVGVPIVAPGDVELPAAHDNIKTVLLNQWQVNHDTGNIIGVV